MTQASSGERDARSGGAAGRGRSYRARVVFLGACAAGMFASGAARARTVPVQDAPGLAAAIAAAQPGDSIVLADGTYASHSINCTQNGSPQASISVSAAHPGKATVVFDDGAGTAVVGFQVSGSDWHFDGLKVRGGCANDDDCEHAFHVVGGALRVVITRSELVDFNAELKVNAVPDSTGKYLIPDDGLFAGNEVHDTRPRNTANPVDKLDIDTASNWVVSGNFVHDASENGAANVAYLGYMKGGGKNGVFERNLVVCSRDIPVQANEARLGLSFGGGGTGAQYCAPAFDPNVPCTVEHTGGIMRNNIIANCNDVGVYLNQSAMTTVAYNTLVATNGVDCRFTSTSGTLEGNVMAAAPHLRNGGTCADQQNLENVTEAQFEGWFTKPLTGDLSLTGGDLSALVGKGPAVSSVTDDYCVRPRSGAYDLGALQVSLGSCATLTPPNVDGGAPPPAADGGLVTTADAGGADAGQRFDAGGSSDAASGTASDGGGAPASHGGSCSCRQVGAGELGAGPMAGGGLFFVLVAGCRRLSRRSARRSGRSGLA